MSSFLDQNEIDELSWWTRTAGGKEVLTVALPLVVSSLSWTVMTFMDRVFLKWVSGDAMAAAFSSSLVWFAVLSLPLGICAYASTFVSQYFGNRQLDRIGPSAWQAVWVVVLVTPLMIATIPLAPRLFALAGHSPTLAALETQYFQVLTWGAPGILAAQALSAFYSGRGLTRVVMVVDACCAVANLILDYILIFGHLGFPAMGIAGAGWATVIALWLKALIYAALVLQPRNRREFQTASGIRFDPKLFRRLIFYGGPSGIQMLLDVMGFTIFVMLIGRLGQVEAEATSMAFSISTLAFMPIWGFGLSASILVGQRLGENREDLATRSVWTSLAIALSYMGGISLLYIVVPDLFLFGFFAGSESSATSDAVRQLARTLLRFVAAYNLLDAGFMIFASAIKGAGDTRFVLRVSTIMATLLAVLSWFVVEVLHLGIFGCWALITGWVWILGVTFFCRFQQGRWRKMRVIEQKEPLDKDVADPEAEPVAI